MLDDSWTESSETWPASGSMRSGVCFRRSRPRPRTSASAGSSSVWPTPTEHGNHNRAGASPGSGDGLSTAAKMWQTPQADSFRSRGGDRKDEMGLDQQARRWQTPRKEGFDAGRHRGNEDSLHAQVKNWPTPQSADGERSSETMMRGNPTLTGAARNWPSPGASDHKGSSQPGQRRRQLSEVAEQSRPWATPRASPNENRTTKPTPSQLEGKHGDYLAAQAIVFTHPDATTSTPGGPSSPGDPTSPPPSPPMRLNPRFSEWIMGWIPGWTHPRSSIARTDYERWATASCRLLRHLLSAY